MNYTLITGASSGIGLELAKIFAANNHNLILVARSTDKLAALKREIQSTTQAQIETFGADGITVHPRPDERHIRYEDVFALNKILKTEFNIEGNPHEQRFIDLVIANKPSQVTLVPDALGQLTSDHGWNTVRDKDFLKEVISLFKKEGIRVSIFVDPVSEMITGAFETGTDRIELYTEAFAKGYASGDTSAVKKYTEAAKKANELGLGINAGHDLDLYNLKYFAENVSGLLEVSIGHALVCDAIYLGLENAVQIYKRQLQNPMQSF